MAFSAAGAAAIAALFNPLPASAAPPLAAPPAAPDAPAIPAVPDTGSRPIPLGTLVMPGQAATTPAATPITTPGVATSPVVAEDERRRAEIATLGDQLIKLGQDRDLAKQQQTVADARVVAAQAGYAAAQREATAAAVDSWHDAAALPPGALGSGLADLDQLAQMQRGETATEESAARQLAIAQAALTAAQAEQGTTTQQALDASSQYDRLNAQIASKQAALQKYETQHADELSAAETAESAQDAALGAQYLAGLNEGRGADQRAIAALQYALNQRGKPYQWSEEGPNSFDCSGLMWAAYHQAAAGDFPLMRVSRDQYWQTRNKVVDRYSLLPGDLLFFSSTNSWTGIHHVAMYAGDGKMVEAPRTGLDVRLVPVRWTRLFQATRVYGSVDGPVQGPDLNAPPPPASGGGTTTSPTTRPPTTGPTTTPPTTGPTTTPPTTTPPTTTPPTTTPPTTTPPTTTPPTTTPPTTTPPATQTTAPAEETTAPTEQTSPSGSEESSPSGSQSSSAAASSSAASSGSASASSD